MTTAIETITPIKDIITAMREPTEKDKELITKAYKFAEEAHKEQKRYSGAVYFVHVSAVGKKLADLGMDARTIAAGLLHDTVEDAHCSEDDIEREFGGEIRHMVDGVTKLGKLKYHGLERHVESLRKLFVATSKDVRVLIIKLADRWHNISTLKYVPEAKRARIALETLEIYAPVANRLSMGKLKGELEDYAFPYAHPEEYKKVQNLITERSKDTQIRLTRVYRTLQRALAKEAIRGVRGEYRVKRTYSLYKKLEKRKWDFEKIYDIAALRVIVPTIGDCYRALGIVHSNWRPLPGRIKDYIAFPRPNGYKSLHTTIFTGDGEVVEVQIRTEEMNREAKFGVAAHFAYKEGMRLSKGRAIQKNFKWVEQISELQQHIDSGEFLDEMRMDFFGDRVFVFTPKGDVVDLPTDASSIDFAYAIHSDIGDHLAGAKVNGKLVGLDKVIKNGDIVEIVTKESAKPTAKWLPYVKTTLARRSIRAHLALEKKKK